MEHVVRWEITVDAESAREAAEKARDAQLRPDTTATVFDVYTLGRDGNPIPGMPVEVDLSDEDDQDGVPTTLTIRREGDQTYTRL